MDNTRYTKQINQSIITNGLYILITFKNSPNLIKLSKPFKA